MSRLEKFSEAEFVKDVERVGGFAIKIYNRAGWPDRLCWVPYYDYHGNSIGPGGHWFWAEWKRRGLPPEPHQNVTHTQLRTAGHTVWVFDDNKAARHIMKEYYGCAF